MRFWYYDITIMMFEQFFNSPIKARLVKFFVYNHNKFFDINDIAGRLDLSAGKLKSHLKELKKAGFLKSKSAHSFSISYKFPYLNEVKGLVLKFPPVSDEFLVQEAKKMGQVKLLIAAGMLVHAQKARTEIVIVGDRIAEKKAERFLRSVEAQAGKELRYVLLTNEEFLYRKKMFDRFVLDVLELQHKKVINKLGI